MKYRFSVLDIFRGLFASFVVLFHMAFFTNTPVINNPIVENSDVFVDFFFVLSGFVITYRYQLMSTTEEFGTFMKKRFFRIYPLHFVMLFVTLLMELDKEYMSHYIHVNKLDNPNNNVLTFFTSLFLVNSIKLFNISDVSWNIPSWSISAEVISYIVFGLVMITIARLSLQRYKSIIYLLTALVALGLLAFITGSFQINYSFDYGFLRGLIGFFTGAFCYMIFSKTVSSLSHINPLLFTFAEIVIVFAIFISIYWGETLKYYGFVYEIIFLLAIYIFSFEKGKLSSILNSSTLLHRVGTYSYSIYLTHAVLLSIFNIVFIRILKFSPEDYSYLFILNLVLIYYCSQWTYKNIEIKFKDGFSVFKTAKSNL
ncbi:acyltransferase [Siphonobacter sp. SORGH_AS_1065]|uniref:acyltransferase family protein n=1 Tax=Siphonobacter sp. SORGH_AS_1065 TaxID=3041795 RepID=UPI00278A3D89|nr:acyltransferase [Siphonobacter sp. SORGH_AS_1065]MDQ1086912.1 peptidoglycan/LPS O-acetylase OafA/YrhL [Siphonobacter sp. SORGH_AS_1065]